MWRYLIPPLLLLISNIFMTFAWYGHLKIKEGPIVKIILLSWGIAFFEYCFQVPANRLGHEVYSASQLKIMQEAITLVVFCLFAIFYLKEPPKITEYIGMGLVFLGILITRIGQ